MQLHFALVSRTTQLEKGPQGLGEQGFQHTARWLVTLHAELPPQEIMEQGSKHF